MWPLISLCTRVLYQNNSSSNARILLLSSPIASESSPLKRGSICSNAKAQGLPSPMQSLARQFQFIQNKWIFQLGVIHQKKNNFSVAVTHVPDQHRSAHITLDRSVPQRASLRRMQNIISGLGIPCQEELASSSVFSSLVYKAPFTLLYNNNALLGDKRELEQTACQHAAALLAPTAQSSARPACNHHSKPGSVLILNRYLIWNLTCLFIFFNLAISLYKPL